MQITKHQLIAILSTFLLIVVFYFGFDTMDPKIKLAEKSRAVNFEITSIDNIRQQAFDSLNATDKAFYDGLQLQLSNSYDDSSRVEVLKSISGFWYRQQEYAMAGKIAEDIAEIYQDEKSWSVVGTTYAAGISNGKNELRRTFNRSKAVNAFETAISINPDNVNHKINLAVSYAELPPEDNPMKGILMLLDLDKNYPDSPGVLYQLARFGMQTNQFDKAIGRLERILEIDSGIIKAHCLLAEALQKVNKSAEAMPHIEACQAGMK